jgi:hypothetical protein
MKAKSYLKLIGFLLAGSLPAAATVGEDTNRAAPTRPNPIKVTPSADEKREDPTPTYREVEKKEKQKERRIGPYKALTFNESILQEVVYRESDQTVWLRLRPEKRNEEIVVKISNQKFANYRKWFTTDDFELVSPANAGKQPNELTDGFVKR